MHILVQYAFIPLRAQANTPTTAGISPEVSIQFTFQIIYCKWKNEKRTRIYVCHVGKMPTVLWSVHMNDSAAQNFERLTNTIWHRMTRGLEISHKISPKNGKSKRSAVTIRLTKNSAKQQKSNEWFSVSKTNGRPTWTTFNSNERATFTFVLRRHAQRWTT